MTNGELFFKTFPCLEQDEEWPNILWWTDEKGKRQLLGDVYDSYFWDEEYKGPTIKNDLGVDCISRQAVLEQAYAYGNGLEPDGYCVNVEDIQALPSVTPIRPKGHWIDKQRLFDSCSAECSSCHKRSNGYMHDNGFSLECKYYDFCPYCGSDMREVEE